MKRKGTSQSLNTRELSRNNSRAGSRHSLVNNRLAKLMRQSSVAHMESDNPDYEPQFTLAPQMTFITSGPGFIVFVLLLVSGAATIGVGAYLLNERCISGMGEMMTTFMLALGALTVGGFALCTLNWPFWVFGDKNTDNRDYFSYAVYGLTFIIYLASGAGAGFLLYLYYTSDTGKCSDRFNSAVPAVLWPLAGAVGSTYYGVVSFLMYGRKEDDPPL